MMEGQALDSGTRCEGPIAGAPSLASTAFDLEDVGYVQEEYVFSGSAKAFQPLGALTSDGRWEVAPDSAAPFRTRLVVYRPSRPERFSGVVSVEWLNVSAGFDIGPDWIYMHRELIR